MLYILYILAIVVLISADQFSKFLIVKNLSVNNSVSLINNFFSITYVKNYGAGFSIMQNQTLFLTVISIIAIMLLSYLLYKTKNKEISNRISFLLIISGAFGNLFDRIRFGYVIDFFDFNIFGYDFPVFNVADSFITIGALILIFDCLRGLKHGKI